MMKSRGWQLAVRSVSGVFLFLAAGTSAFAASLTVRDIQLQGGTLARVMLDGNLPRGSINVEYLRDIVQVSIPNATIYPAKILHSEGEGQPFSKVFAYQYAPNLVRVRFSVSGKAEVFQGKLKFENLGKVLEVRFPENTGAVPPKEPEQEKSLLSKVLGQTKAPVVEPEPEKAVEAPKVHLGAPVKAVELGGKTQGPSVFRSLLAMVLVVGGLGAVLVFLKKKRPAAGKKNGESWIQQILGGNKKDRSYIEVLASHALGPKQSITVVRIKEQQFVLGVTQDSVHLITQLDSEESELGLLDDPKVADSLGKMFGAPVKTDPFESLLKGSSGAGAVVARNAYGSQMGLSPQISSTPNSSKGSSGVREQIRRRLQGMDAT